MAKQLIKRVVMATSVAVLSGWVLVTGMTGIAQALPVPPGLNPGDRYYLTFLTNGTIAASSGDIKTYNDFVNAQAGQNGSKAAGATWVAIASTATVDAKDNLNFAGQSNIAPIYLLDGKTQVVKQASDLFSGADLLHAINIDQFGNADSALTVWTGTDTNGMKTANPLGGSPATRGNPQRVNFFWINMGAGPSNFADDFYAVSKLLTVPTPEPSTWLLLATGFAGLASLAWRRTRQWSLSTAGAPSSVGPPGRS